MLSTKKEHFKYKDTLHLKEKEQKMIYHTKINLNNAIFARLISELVNFRQQNVTTKNKVNSQ